VLELARISDSVEHGNSFIQYQPNNMFWSNGPLLGWQDWKIQDSFELRQRSQFLTYIYYK